MNPFTFICQNLLTQVGHPSLCSIFRLRCKKATHAAVLLHTILLSVHKANLSSTLQNNKLGSILSPPRVFAPLINLDLLYSNSQNNRRPRCAVWNRFWCLYLKCECLVRRGKRRDWRRNVCMCVFVCRGALSADTGTDAGTQGNPDTQRS